MDKEDQEENKKRIMELLNSVRFPDPKVFKNVLEDSKKLSFKDFKQYDLEKYSSEELLDKAETIAKLIWFSSDTKNIGRKLHTEFNYPVIAYIMASRLESVVREFVGDLERLGAKTSTSQERKFDLVKEYNLMKGYSELTLIDPSKMPTNYIFFFEAVVYKFLDPIARKLQPTNKKFLPAGECIKIINRKTNKNHSELLNSIDIELRNGIQHYSFTHDNIEKKYFYTNKEGKIVTLTYSDLQQKVAHIHLFYSFLANEIDHHLTIEAIRSIIRFLLEREYGKYNSHLLSDFWERMYSLSREFKFDYLSHLCGLHATGAYFLKRESTIMKEFYQSLLEAHTHLRNDPNYIRYSFEFIISLIRSEEGLILKNGEKHLIRELFSILNYYLQHLTNKNEEEMKYWITTSKILTRI